MSVLVVGSVALDTVETPFGKRDDVLGGSAMYFSVAASYFSPVQLVGVVGEDFPDKGIEILNRHEVDIRGLQKEPGKTFRWGGKYHTDINHRDTLFTHLNVFESFSPKIPEAYTDSAYLFLANIHPALQLDVLSQVNNPELIVTDTMNLWIDTTLEDLKRVIHQTDILLLSDSEIRQLMEEPNLIKAGRALLKQGPDYVIIKKGEHGAMLLSDETIFFAPGFPLEDIKDPTGAGDVFAGGFVGYLHKSGTVNASNLKQAVNYGSTLASYACEDFSLDKLVQLSEDTIEDRFRRFRELTHFEVT